MALAVCLLFDRRSERAVRALWDRLERAGVPSLRSHTHGRHVPHVSYAVLRTWEVTAVSAAVAGLGALAPVELTFDGVGLFRRGRAWLLAGAAAEFVTRQERVVDAVTATGAELHKHYRPGRWLPHCSVAPRAGLAQLPVLVAAVYDVLPLETRLDRVTLIDSSTGELWPVSTSPCEALSRAWSASGWMTMPAYTGTGTGMQPQLNSVTTPMLPPPAAQPPQQVRFGLFSHLQHRPVGGDEPGG